MVDVKVLFFAKAREVAGVPEESIQLQEGEAGTADTQALVQELVRRHPGLASVLQTCVLAVNQEYVQLKDRLPLKSSDEVAIIPPLSGADAMLTFQHALLEQTCLRETGAQPSAIFGI